MTMTRAGYESGRIARLRAANEYEAYRARQTELQRLRRQRARRSGACTNCRRRSAEPGMSHCRYCLDRKSLRKKVARGTAIDTRIYFECCQAFGMHRCECHEMRRAA